MTKQLYLVAVDGSEWGERAARHAAFMAKQTGAAVKLITVIPWSGFQPMTLDEMAHRPLEKAEEERHAKEDVLKPLVEKYAADGVAIDTEFHWGDPVDVIRKRVKDLHVNQVFIGRRGRSRISDLLLGSVANKLAHVIGIPIVLVP